MNTAHKKIYIEALRILACFFVIYNHTDINGFFLFSLYPDTSIQYWLYMFVSICCKMAVPTFFMISGALLLQKKESIQDVYKRVLKYIIIIFVFSFASYLFFNHKNLSSISIKSFFTTLYTSNHNGTYWYLYAYIPFLMSLPLVRPMAQNMKNEHFLYMLICYIFFTAILPITEYLLWQGNYSLNGNLRMGWVASNAIIYPCIGYYLENRMDITKAKKYLLPLWCINILCILTSCFMTFYQSRITGECNEISSQTFFGTFSITNAIVLFITFKYFFTTKVFSKAFVNLICSLGACTLGIYLIAFPLYFIFNHFHVLDFLKITLGINPMISILIFCLLEFFAGYFIIIIAKFIPLLNKLI